MRVSKVPIDIPRAHDQPGRPNQDLSDPQDEPPTSVPELRRIMGMINQLGKIHSQPCRANTAPACAFEQELTMAVGTGPKQCGNIRRNHSHLNVTGQRRRTKSLDSLPPRGPKVPPAMDCFQYMIVHVPGKQLYIADTLSRAPVSSPTETDTVFEELAEMAVTGHFNHLLAGPSTLDGYRHAQDSDQLCTTINGYCRDG